jgi:cellulose synthase/poly-beta-1,6-N-acetylglucosamine synthase-like glycosyltransferase
VDWIAFLDDDERADSYWLHNLMEKGYRDVKRLAIVTPHRRPILSPFWRGICAVNACDCVHLRSELAL